MDAALRPGEVHGQFDPFPYIQGPTRTMKDDNRSGRGMLPSKLCHNSFTYAECLCRGLEWRQNMHVLKDSFDNWTRSLHPDCRMGQGLPFEDVPIGCGLTYLL